MEKRAIVAAAIILSLGVICIICQSSGGISGEAISKKDSPVIIANPYMEKILELNERPAVVISKLRAAGVNTLQIGLYNRNKDISNKEAKTYYERLLNYTDKNKYVDIFITIKKWDDGDCDESNLYCGREEYQDLINRHPSIKAVIFDDYAPPHEEALLGYGKFMKNIKFKGSYYGVVYSGVMGNVTRAIQRANEVHKTPRPLDGYIDYVEANFGGTPQNYCGKSWCDIKSREYNGLKKIKSAYPNSRVIAGFYMYVDDKIVFSNSRFSAFLASARKNGAEGYLFRYLDWGDKNTNLNWMPTGFNSPAKDTPRQQSKYAIVRSFTSRFN